MKKYILIFLLPVVCFGQNPDSEDVLKDLDRVLAHRTEYNQAKEKRIEDLKNQVGAHTLQEQQYLINKTIIEEYKTYQCDSAIVYVKKNIEIAGLLDNEEYLNESKTKLALIYAYAGLFSESSRILDTLVPEELPENLRGAYHAAYYRFYDTLIKYINEEKYSDRYKERMIENLGLYLLLQPESASNKQVENLYKDFLSGKYRYVITQLSGLIPTMDPESHAYAIATSCLAYAYMAVDESPELQKRYLAMAAVTDAKLSIKDHSALLNLAILLHGDGDVDRAYRYINIAQEDANFFNSRHRNIMIARAFPIIEKTYQDKIQKQKRELTYSLILVSLLAAGLFVTIIYIYKQVRVVSKARRTLKLLNAKLDEANHIKEEYIGYFLNLSSVYINKLDEYKLLVVRKIKARQTDDLLKKASSNNQKDIEELYRNFDVAFLKLYPDFVSEFNALLKEEVRYKLKSNELNTELRIFALIRLGITDSKQIASFLRYSVQTVYNYRSKVRKKALNEDEDFEERIKNIGMPNENQFTEP